LFFSDLQLGEAVLRAVADAGYETPTPIQAQAIPYVLMGRDLLACAQTGTGKTASFTLPMIDILAAGQAKARMPRSLILEPTRELAAQVAENFDTYGKYLKLTKALIIGGESMGDQLRNLEKGADVLIATPGRLMDVFDRGALLMNDVRVFVIDEADRMLDMGFIPDVERIVTLVSRQRQTLMFSATMPPAIRKLADAFMSNPKEITVAPPSTPAETVSQGLVIVADAAENTAKEKRAALRRLIESETVQNALVFCNRKRDVGIVQRSLSRHGLDSAMLHGDMAQSARTEVLDRFKKGEIRLLVCSDVAARGLDIAGMSHVFNFDVPTNAEDYVHRIGRTGRAGKTGRALTVAAPEDGRYIQQIEALIGKPIDRLEIEGVEVGELDTSGGRRRRGRGGKKPTGRTSSSDERPKQAKGRDRKPTKPAPRNEERTEEARFQPRKKAGKERKDEPVIGLGEHVPAFLLRDPRAGETKTEAKDDTAPSAESS
jgi:superfamily II DNA/RNA helicase